MLPRISSVKPHTTSASPNRYRSTYSDRAADTLMCSNDSCDLRTASRGTAWNTMLSASALDAEMAATSRATLWLAGRPCTAHTRSVYCCVDVSWTGCRRKPTTSTRMLVTTMNASRCTDLRSTSVMRMCRHGSTASTVPGSPAGAAANVASGSNCPADVCLATHGAGASVRRGWWAKGASSSFRVGGGGAATRSTSSPGSSSSCGDHRNAAGA